MNDETKAIHAGQQSDPATGALIPPIHLSTTFERDPDGSYPHGYIYSRDSNPNRGLLEQRIASLEGGSAAAAFSSGSAATMSVLQALSPGDHVLAPEDFYFGIRQLLQEVFVPWGLEVTFIDLTDVAQLRASLQQNTRLIMVETPSNPLMKIADIQALADAAHDAGAYLACDNTVASPILQRPFEHGADLVIHATTKYLGGHSDVLGGLVVTKTDGGLWPKITRLQKLGGAVPSPFECWLALRGIQTLPARARTQADHALQVARFLDAHPAVERVHYPGLEKDPGYSVASKQMVGYGGLLSFLVKGGSAEAMAVAAKVKLFIRATSFGGTHSLIEHRASIEAPGTRTPQNLLRLSIGLESVDDLIDDLHQALG